MSGHTALGSPDPGLGGVGRDDGVARPFWHNLDRGILILKEKAETGLRHGSFTIDE